MKRFILALAILLTLVVGGTSFAQADEFEEDLNGNGIPDSQEKVVGKRVPLGNPIVRAGKVQTWNSCYLGQLQLRLSVNACGPRPDGQTWQDPTLWMELINTPWREDRLGRSVAIPTFGGVFNPKKNRYEQVEAGMYGYEIGKAWKDHANVGVTEFRPDSPPFWSYTDLRAKPIGGSRVVSTPHPTSKEEVGEIKLAIVNMKREISKLKSQPSGSGENSADVAKQIEGLEKALGEMEKSLATTATAKSVTDLEGRVLVLEEAPKPTSNGRFHLEADVTFNAENWQAKLSSGAMLDTRHPVGVSLGFGPAFDDGKFVLRAVIFGGLHAGAGFVAGGRVDVFLGLFPRARWFRFGGSVGVKVDWFHVLPEYARPAIVMDTSVGVHVTYSGGIEIAIPESPVTVTGWVGGASGNRYPYSAGDGTTSVPVLTPVGLHVLEGGLRIGADFK